MHGRLSYSSVHSRRRVPHSQVLNIPPVLTSFRQVKIPHHINSSYSSPLSLSNSARRRNRWSRSIPTACACASSYPGGGSFGGAEALSGSALAGPSTWSASLATDVAPVAGVAAAGSYAGSCSRCNPCSTAGSIPGAPPTFRPASRAFWTAWWRRSFMSSKTLW